MLHEVLVDRSDLLAALSVFRDFDPRHHSEEALVGYEGSDLRISMIGASVAMPVRGEWTGEVRVPASFVITLARKPPPGDPISLAMRDRRFHVGTFSIDSIIQFGPSGELRLPLDHGLLDLVALKVNLSADRVERAGLSTPVAAAWQETRKRAEQAARCLAPLGIGRNDIVEFIEDRLRQNAKGEGKPVKSSATMRLQRAQRY